MREKTEVIVFRSTTAFQTNNDKNDCGKPKQIQREKYYKKKIKLPGYNWKEKAF